MINCFENEDLFYNSDFECEDNIRLEYFHGDPLYNTQDFRYSSNFEEVKMIVYPFPILLTTMIPRIRKIKYKTF